MSQDHVNSQSPHEPFAQEAGNDDARFHAYRLSTQSATSTGADPPHEALPEAVPAHEPPAPAPRGIGYLLAIAATWRGARTGSERAVLRSATAQGSLAGHTPNGQPEDPGVKAREAEGVARMRAARAARERTHAVAPQVAAYKKAAEQIKRVGEELDALTAPIAALEQRVDQLDDEISATAATVPAPGQAPPVDVSEWPDIADDAVPGYRVGATAKAATFTASALVEAAFTGSFVSSVASIGIPGVPVEVNLALPWVSGSAVGALIPIAAERAAHAAATAAPDAPWYVRRAPAIAIGVPAVLGLGRAIEMAGSDPLSGVLGLGVALLLTALAVMSAAIGHREGEGCEHDARRARRAQLRDERRRDLTPPPPQEARELAAVRQLRADKQAALSALLSQRDRLRRERAAASEARAKAAVAMRVEQAASEQDAQEELGLGVANVTSFVLRRDAVTATVTGTRPDAYDAEVWKVEPGDLPRLRSDELLEEPGLPDEGGQHDDETEQP